MEYEITATDKMRRIADEKIATKDRAALGYLLNHPDGRWFLMRLFERCHLIGGGVFPEDNVNRLLILEGERRVGLHIQNLITSDMEALASKQTAESEYHALMNELKAMISAVETKEETI